MTRQTIIGLVFLFVGLVLVALAVSPVVLGLLATPRTHGDVSLPFLGTGVALAVFGAWMIPSSGAGPTATQMIAVVGPYIPRIPGISRVDDPKPVPPPERAP